MAFLSKDFLSRKKKPAIQLRGMVLFASVVALSGCVQAPSVMGGKRLVLEFEDSHIGYDFPQGDEYSMTTQLDPARPHRVYHRYDAGTQVFYEMSETLNVNDGRGESHWRLDFSTPTTGKATLLRKHPWAFRGKNPGFTVPFRVIPLSDAAVTISSYGGKKHLDGAAAESVLRELEELYAGAEERKLNDTAVPYLSAEGVLTGHAQYDFPLADIESGEQSWSIARGLQENEALLLSRGTDSYRVPNQQKMRLLFNRLMLRCAF